MYESLLIPLDGSEHSRAALDIASRLVKPGKTTVHLLHVSDLHPMRELPGGIDAGASALASGASFTPEEIEQMERNLGEQLKHAERAGLELIEQVKSEAGLADLETHDVVRTGQPADIIIQEAETLGVDAIVMGSRGISNLASLIVGSVSHKVMHTARCRVILVH